MGLTRARSVLAKTAAYTVTSSDCGALITNRGATGSVTITLPAQTTVGAGFWVDVHVVADQTVVVATTTADTLITMHDATSDSIAWQTSSEKIGNGATFIADGTGWIVQQHPATLSANTTVSTVTVATA